MSEDCYYILDLLATYVIDRTLGVEDKLIIRNHILSCDKCYKASVDVNITLRRLISMEVSSVDCDKFIKNIDDYINIGTLDMGTTIEMRVHLDYCDDCREIYLDLREKNEENSDF